MDSPTAQNDSTLEFAVPSHSIDSFMSTPQQLLSPMTTPPRMKLSIPSLSANFTSAPNPTPTDAYFMHNFFPLLQPQINFNESDLLHAHLGNMDIMSPMDQNSDGSQYAQFNFMDQLLMNEATTPISLQSPAHEAFYQFPVMDPTLLQSNSANSTPMQHPLSIPSFDESLDSPPLSPRALNKSPTTPTAPGLSNADKKKKKMRFRATEAELTFLLTVFEANPFPSTRQRIQLAEKLGLDPKQILFWFQNRRATLKSNGILAVKPKKTNSTTNYAFKKNQNYTLSPLSADNPFFYVAEKGGLVNVEAKDEE
ncbi:hypothetical protein HDU98_007488 [Podochytrium sp. JEL0797]|nr:hypothetical protein HDU98_007488 [Podochytrium sp. JEL0797]